jgi:hypothetical protein
VDLADAEAVLHLLEQRREARLLLAGEHLLLALDEGDEACLGPWLGVGVGVRVGVRVGVWVRVRVGVGDRGSRGRVRAS